MYAAKAAIAHYQNVVAALRFRRNRRHKRLKVLANVQFITQW